MQSKSCGKLSFMLDDGKAHLGFEAIFSKADRHAHQILKLILMASP